MAGEETLLQSLLRQKRGVHEAADRLRIAWYDGARQNLRFSGRDQEPMNAVLDESRRGPYRRGHDRPPGTEAWLPGPGD